MGSFSKVRQMQSAKLGHLDKENKNMKFIIVKFRSGSFGVQTQDPLTKADALHLVKKLNEVLA